MKPAETKQRYIDGFLGKNLDKLKKKVELNWDGIGYICGGEGDGKTTLATQVCYYLDNTFNIDRVVFNGQQFKETILKAKPFQAVLFDESYLAFNNRSLWNKETQIIISLLTMIRKKQLFIMIVSPTFFDIQKYIAIHRSRFMAYVYANDLERGYFMMFDKDRKQTLYMKGKKDYNMNVVKANYRGRFAKWFPLDEKLYDDKKEEALQEYKDIAEANKTIKSEDQLAKEDQRTEDNYTSWLRSNRLLQLGAMKTIADKRYNISYRGYQARLTRLRQHTPT